MSAYCISTLPIVCEDKMWALLLVLYHCRRTPGNRTKIIILFYTPLRKDKLSGCWGYYLSKPPIVVSNNDRVWALQLLNDLKALVELGEHIHHWAREQSVLRCLLELKQKYKESLSNGKIWNIHTLHAWLHHLSCWRQGNFTKTYIFLRISQKLFKRPRGAK